MIKAMGFQVKQIRFRWLIGVSLWIGVALLGLSLPIHAQPGANCSAGFYVDQILSNGARWQLCWEQRTLDGIVYRDIYFTPPGGTSRRVLAEGSISQVHVPYDDNSARFHDITDDGFGNANLNDLTAVECPKGTLLKFGTKNAICQQIVPRGYAFKGLGRQQQGELLSLFSVSTSGDYNYVPVWRFLDDGTIELQMGALGKLQRFTSDSRFGWPVRADGTRATSHIHNYYWRLDFDLGETANDDIVEEFNYVSSADNNSRTLGISRLATEAGRSVDPTGLRSWRIRDGSLNNASGQSISYQLEPIDMGNRDVGPTYEPWTANDFYVTKANQCERYVSHNPQLNGCANNLAGFVNGESLVDTDVVLWYGVTFHHIPRDEDEALMHAHWNGFRLTPRDWHDANPMAKAVNTCAVGDVTCDGKQDAADALFMLQYDVRLRAVSNQLPLPANTLYGYSCDVSGEGACNALDALFSLQCSVGLPNLFCPASSGITNASSPQDAHIQETSALALNIVDALPGEGNQYEQWITKDGAPGFGAAKLGALSLVLNYNPDKESVIGCQADPDQLFDLATCNIEPTTGSVRFSLLSAAGVLGEGRVGVVKFAPSASGVADVTELTWQSAIAATVDGRPLPIQNGHSAAGKAIYLPLIVR